MSNDNDTIIIFSPVEQREIKPISKPRPRAKRKPRIEKIKTGIIKNVRMDIEELNELNELNLTPRTRGDIFKGQNIDRIQKEDIHKEGKVYVRGHTKKVKNEIVVVKPYLRNK